MDSRPEIRTAIMCLAAVALATSAWWMGAQFHPHWWATWLAPLPLLWLATRVRARWAALAPFAAIVIGDLPRWTFGSDMLRQPVPATMFMIAAPALVMMLAVLLYRRLALRGRHLAAALAAPAMSSSIYFINSMTSVDGSGGCLAYTQMNALPVIQVAALTGLWGIGFLVMLGPATLAVLLDHKATAMARLRTALVGGGLIVLALGYGAWRLQAPEAGTRTVKVGLVSLHGAYHPGLSSAAGQHLLGRYVAAVQKLAAAGAQIVVMPETVVTVPTLNVPALHALARSRGITLLTGVDYRPPGAPERNMSLVFTPRADAPVHYAKHHLVPGWEKRYTPGNSYSMLPGAPRIGLAICKDMDFPAMGRAYGTRRTQLLLVPAWDFDTDDWMHSRMAILRGVESGFAIARAARDGQLTLSDDRGRVLASANSVERDATLLGNLPLRHTHTLYTRWGNWFAWLVLALLVGLLVLALRSPRAVVAPAGIIHPASP